MALKRSKSVKFTRKPKTIIRGGHKVQTHVLVRKKAYPKK